MNLKCCFCPQDAIVCKFIHPGNTPGPAVRLPVCVKHSAYNQLVEYPLSPSMPTEDTTPVLQVVAASLWQRFGDWIVQQAREKAGFVAVIDGEGNIVPDAPRPAPAVCEFVATRRDGTVIVRNASGRRIEAGEAVSVKPIPGDWPRPTRIVPTSQGGMQHVDDHGQIKCWGDGCGVYVTPKADYLAYCSSCEITSCPKCDVAYGQHCLGVSPLFHPICPAPKMAGRPERCSLHGCYRDAENGIEFCRTHATVVQMFPPPFHAGPKFAPGPECGLPPAGYRCTRGAGHEGPCAAWPHAPTAEGLVADLKAKRDAYFDGLALRAAKHITPEVAAGLVADCEAVLGAHEVRRIEDSHGGQLDPDAPIVIIEPNGDGNFSVPCADPGCGREMIFPPGVEPKHKLCDECRGIAPPDAGDHDSTCMCVDCLPHPHPNELGVPGE